MPIDLHPACERRLIEFLSKAIKGLSVDYGSMLSLEYLWDRLYNIDTILPEESKKGSAKEKASEQLRRYISGSPLFDFVKSIISDHIDNVYQFDIKAKRFPLTEVDRFKNPTQSATEIIDKLKTLPWLYRFRFSLPNEIANCLDAVVNSVSLSDDTKFVVIEKEENKILTAHSEQTDMFVLNNSHVYIEFKSFGFVGKQLDTITENRAKIKVRAFFGLAVALGLFRTVRGPLYRQDGEYIITCDITNGESCNFVKSISLEERYNRAIARTLLNPEFLQMEDATKERWI